MSVDGIAKPGLAPVISGGTGVSGGVGVSATAPSALSITGTERFTLGEANPVNPLKGSTELGKLTRGEITLDQFLEAKVEEATQALPGLSAEELAFVKDTLRKELRQDPVLLELVRRTTSGTAE